MALNAKKHRRTQFFMKDFFGKYSYSIIKMFVNQIAISIFGLMLSMATTNAQSSVLSIVVSAFAILFYLFLLYTLVWEIGAKDKIAVDVGKKQYKMMTGLWMSLVANIPNILFAVIFAVSQFFANNAGVAKFSGVISFIANILQGMYFGTISSITFPSGKLMSQMWWTYFVIIIPALVTSFLAYFLGHKDFRFFAVFSNKKSNNK